jgi:LPXTG-motif cell wall-anchored protein
VWPIYLLGFAGAAILLLSALFTIGAVIGSDDEDVGFDISLVALLVWGGLVLLAVGTWVWRRRRTASA